MVAIWESPYDEGVRLVGLSFYQNSGSFRHARPWREAFEYVRKDNPAAAVSWLERVDKVLGRLASFPLSGVVPKDLRLAARGYLMVVNGEHLALYVVLPETVEVRRVLHGRRRYGFLFTS